MMETNPPVSKKHPLNKRLIHVKPSATLVMNELSVTLAASGQEVYRLGFGQSPFPVPDVLVQALRDNAHQKDYLPVKGLLPLRKQIASYFNRKYGLDTSYNDILIGPGSKELIFDFQLAYAMDELLLPTPSWVSYEPQAHLTDHKVVWLPGSKDLSWKLMPEVVDDYCHKNGKKNRVIIFNYPSNPLGVSYTNEELKALAEVFRRHEMIVIADEIYGEVHHTGRHHTLAGHYPEGTVISTGLSKWAGAGGWRLGVFVMPKDLRHILEAMSVIGSETYTTASAPIQYAALQAYQENDALDTYVHHSRKILRAVGNYTYDQLRAFGAEMPVPEGGFYLYPDFNKWKERLLARNIHTSVEFCDCLLKETGVALLPGVAFGHGEDNFSARLSYVDFDGRMLLEMIQKNPGIITDATFVEQYCPRMVRAIKKLEQWLHAL
jgi:aspartate/methionine/tyrosine aminotransferase